MVRAFILLGDWVEISKKPGNKNDWFSTNSLFQDFNCQIGYGALLLSEQDTVQLTDGNFYIEYLSGNINDIIYISSTFVHCFK